MSDEPPADQHRDIARVRPYLHTRGRTRPGRDLPVEALLTATEAGRRQQTFDRPELRALARLCHTPCSVAEASAYLHVPLGVIRVLASDLAESGLITIGGAEPGGPEHPSRELLQRVLDGLHNL